MVKAIVQTGYRRAELRDRAADALTPLSIKIETKFVPLLRYDLLKLDQPVPAQLPAVLGYGATGIVKEVGSLRSTALLGQPVLLLHPRGTFQEEITSSIPPLAIPLISGVTLRDAAALIGGGDLALTLFKIAQKKQQPLVIYGADSVTGLILMQLLTHHSQLPFIPKVQPISQDYLNEKATRYNIDTARPVNSTNKLVFDLAGAGVNSQLLAHLQGGDQVISVAQKDVPGIQFISKPSLPKDYLYLMQEIQHNRLFIPINQVFSYLNFERALAAQAHGISRGRNLIAFQEAPE